MAHRPERVASLIREELSKLIERELEFPGALVTLTEVDVTKKMDYAKVGVSIFPAEKNEEAFRMLKAAQGEMQHRLNRILNIKPMPRIDFYHDYGPENAARIEKTLLTEIEKEGRGE